MQFTVKVNLVLRLAIDSDCVFRSFLVRIRQRTDEDLKKSSLNLTVVEYIVMAKRDDGYLEIHRTYLVVPISVRVLQSRRGFDETAVTVIVSISRGS